MALRWCAAGMVEASKQFRRVNGYLHLPALRRRWRPRSPRPSPARARTRRCKRPDNHRGRHQSSTVLGTSSGFRPPPDYGSGGWGFESLAARHQNRWSAAQSPGFRVMAVRQTATQLRPRWWALPTPLRPPATPSPAPTPQARGGGTRQASAVGDGAVPDDLIQQRRARRRCARRVGLGLVVDYLEHGRTFPNRRANAGPDQNYFGLKIFLGKVRPFTSPRRGPSTGSDHCSFAGVFRLNATVPSTIIRA
jgi:hypothetical protein